MEHQTHERLVEIVMMRIHKEEKKAVLRRAGFFSLISFGSFVSLVPAFGYLSSAMSTSGFSNFFSLLFSDGSLLLSHTGEFVLSLVESLPVIEFLAFLVIAFVGLSALASLISDIKIIRHA